VWPIPPDAIYHLANEEAIYVLEGSGTLRIGGEQVRISKGTYVALPARAKSAHQIVNDSPGWYGGGTQWKRVFC
jgi:uncharacterized cupin superfamily protein